MRTGSGFRLGRVDLRGKLPQGLPVPGQHAFERFTGGATAAIAIAERGHFPFKPRHDAGLPVPPGLEPVKFIHHHSWR